MFSALWGFYIDTLILSALMGSTRFVDQMFEIMLYNILEYFKGNI